jgi:hypothetical protein
MEDIAVGGFRAERTALRQITAWLQTSPGPSVNQYRGVFKVGGVEALIDLNSNSDDRAEPLNGEDLTGRIDEVPSTQGDHRSPNSAEVERLHTAERSWQVAGCGASIIR